MVMGGSLAGLVTARVLADHFRHVVVIERDTLAPEPAHRRFVPQSHHAHGLLASGARVLAGLFPGWSAEIRDRSRFPYERAAAIAEKPMLTMRGETVVRTPVWWAGGVAASRILIEHTIRERVAGLPSVELRTGTGVTGVLAGRGRVEGVRTTGGDVPADLVVDATGRPSRLADWFAELGYDRPRAEVTHGPVHYASCVLRPDDDFDPDWFVILGGGVADHRFHGAVVLPIEDGLYHCTLGTIGSDEPLPVDPDGYLAVARSLPSPLVAEAIARSTVVSPPRRYRVPSNRFLRYDRLRRRPAGIVALGDAVAAFNPIYGQGMSVAARAAVALGAVLADTGAEGDLEARAAAAIAAQVRPAWSLAVGEDLRAGARVEGIRALPVRKAAGRYRNRVERAAAIDPEVALAYSDTVHLLRGPAALAAPRLARRVLRPRPRPSAPVPATAPAAPSLPGVA